MTVKTIVELYDTKPTIEIDDVHVAACMVDELRGCHKDARVMVLARWAARLRTYYVEIGREVERDDIKDVD